jgi:hypothetical protein
LVSLACPGSSGVEQWIENPRVGGSIPPLGTTLFSRLTSKPNNNWILAIFAGCWLEFATVIATVFATVWNMQTLVHAEASFHKYFQSAKPHVSIATEYRTNAVAHHPNQR